MARRLLVPRAVRLDAAERLQRARVLGAAGLAVLAQQTVDMPGGYFGPSEVTTPAGRAFTLLQIALGLLALRLPRRRRPSAAFALYAINIAAFVPVVVADPVIAGGLVLWQTWLLGFLVFPRLPSNLPSGDGECERWLARSGPAARHLLLVSLVAGVAVDGYHIGDSAVALALAVAFAALALAHGAGLLPREWREGRRLRVVPVPIFVVLGLVLSITGGDPRIALTWWAIAQLWLLAVLLLRLPTFDGWVSLFFGRPPMLAVVSFLVLIALGTLLLSLPAASTGEPLGAVDALFTATSATCVTGLIVLDTGTAFTPFGQAVILGLIQAGGLNMMVLSAFAALLLGQGLGLRGERAVAESIGVEPERSAIHLVRFIVLATFVLEAVGGVVLAVVYRWRGLEWADAAWHGAFHAVSAFCNAGFSLHADSLVGFGGDPLFLGTVSVLIVVGGLGFTVLHAAATNWRRERRGPLATQVRLVLWATALLLVAGAVLYGAFEWGSTLEEPRTDGSVVAKLVDAGFQSVTLRTAGFNSVPFEALQPVTIWMMLAFMIIGASPGGTGGGVKTTTAAVLLASVPATLRGREHATLFGREFSFAIAHRAAAIVTLFFLTLFVATGVLMATQPLPFDALIFEAVSALATVGLSLGITAELDAFGRLVLSIVMLCGRVGPLTVALLLARPARGRLRYPEARLMVG